MYEYGKDFTAETLEEFFRRKREKQGEEGALLKSEVIFSENKEEEEMADGDFI